MINHGRTLLLNKDGAFRPAPTFFLEEYVPEDFSSLGLPGYLVTIRNVLMGDGSDDAFENFRLWQFMKLIHSTEFEAYLTALDSRVTYLTDRSIVEAKNTYTVSPSSVPAQGVQIFFVGDPSYSSAIPRLEKVWEVEVTSALEVKSVNLQDGSVQEVVVQINDGLTSLIPLAGEKEFSIRIQADPLPLGAKWLVQTFSTPRGDVLELLDPLSRLGNAVLFNLFDSTEPYKTFRELWEKHFQVHYRLAGIILAWIYRAEEVRRA